MPTVKAETLNPIHTRAGRACLNWSINDLSKHSGQTASNIKKFESGRQVSEKARQALIDTLLEAGVELLNGKRYGARLMHQSKSIEL